MKHLIHSILTLVFTLMIQSFTYSFDKTLTWSFTNPRDNSVVFLGEKGSVQEALIRDGVLPDPFIGMNEKQFDWIEDYEWTFTSDFFLTENDLKDHYIDIELPNVDTYAKIYLNGSLILTCKNAFLPYRLTIKHHLKIGKNELKAVFTPPVLYHKDAYLKASYKLPAPNDVNKKIAIAPYTRKPQYQFGWDWALRMNTIGFNKPVKIISYNENKIIQTSIQTISVENNKAVIDIAILLAQHPSEKLQWKSKLFGTIDWKKEDKWLKATVILNNPQLWWPINFGEQHLYNDEWTLLSKEDKLIETISKGFGVRTSKLIQNTDEYGTSYEIEVNGKVIFCKGGDVIPQEIFPAKVTNESIQKLVEQMSVANFNMVRVWGGGYYPDEYFFEQCDKKGIMVWQDFMFACSMYPGSDEFLDNVKQEIDYHIPRMTSHPSVVLLNGNNEVDVAWKNWGFQIQYGLVGKSVKEIEKAYDDLFKKLIPERVLYYSNTPYIHTSPLSNWGKAEYYNHGSQHYWGVWHGKDPIEDFGKKIGRFNAEYGFQSFPEYSTLSKVIDKKDWNLDSDVMKLRQKSYVGNGMIKKQSDILFGKTNDFDTFIYYSQLTQAKAVGIAISGHRVDWPRCSGTLYWQVNDCWPAPTWSSVDYYNNWKALHYEVQKDFENIAVLAVERELNQKQFYLVADACNEYTTFVSFDFYDLKGNWLEQDSIKINVKSQSVNSLPIFDMIQNKPTDYIVVAKWNDDKNKLHKRTFYNLTNKKLIAKEPQTKLELQKGVNNSYEIILTTDKPLLNCWIYSENKSFHLNQNFETLLPGVHRFSFNSENDLTIDEIKIMYGRD
ncbi:MAG: hypothetical protein M9916_10570 [Crocinitomicaceae bacterium]|nr:hypothetical protein [Crocinitomicaceae bacterium]